MRWLQGSGELRAHWSFFKGRNGEVKQTFWEASEC